VDDVGEGVEAVEEAVLLKEEKLKVVVEDGLLKTGFYQ